MEELNRQDAKNTEEKKRGKRKQDRRRIEPPRTPRKR
jgi:hypothetical protein